MMMNRRVSAQNVPKNLNQVITSECRVSEQEVKLGSLQVNKEERELFLSVDPHCPNNLFITLPCPRISLGYLYIYYVGKRSEAPCPLRIN